VILLLDVDGLLVDLVFEFINVLLLLFQLLFFILDVPRKLIDLRIRVLKLVLCVLKISLASKSHVVDKTQTFVVLLFDIIYFLFCVLLDLPHCLFVVLHHRFNLSFQMLNLLSLNHHEVVVVLQLVIGRRFMLILQGLQRLSVMTLLFLLLLLQLLVPRCVVQHFLGVLALLLFDFFTLFLCQVFDLLLEIVLHLLFGDGQLVVAGLVLVLDVLDLVL
jgi:hypothetical protein